MSNQTDQRESPDPTSGMLPWGHLLAITTAIVFFISLAFPVTAALTRNIAAFPQWWGVLDVGIAFILAKLAATVLPASVVYCAQKCYNTSQVKRNSTIFNARCAAKGAIRFFRAV